MSTPIGTQDMAAQHDDGPPTPTQSESDESSVTAFEPNAPDDNDIDDDITFVFNRLIATLEAKDGRDHARYEVLDQLIRHQDQLIRNGLEAKDVEDHARYDHLDQLIRFGLEQSINDRASPSFALVINSPGMLVLFGVVGVLVGALILRFIVPT
ncbi:hypothetical protein F5Y18DRAFT_279098 [Xylariaceae sp. FL1019]|nr:hypothetical protein F5Y18DRAFT_279098 [Xylariaceae sp. FL1019]